MVMTSTQFKQAFFNFESLRRSPSLRRSFFDSKARFGMSFDNYTNLRRAVIFLIVLAGSLLSEFVNQLISDIITPHL
jgi:hypothetical protein